MRRCFLVALIALLVHGAQASSSVVALFSDVKGAIASKFNLKDDQGQQMACVHVYETKTAEMRDAHGPYYGVYHSRVGNEFQVRLAGSSDLMNWHFVRTLLQNADMPFISHVNGSDWLLLLHEQWMNSGSLLPSRLGFKLFYNETDLFSGAFFNSFVAPLSVGVHSQLEGTPSVYQARLEIRKDFYMLDADVGFHFNDESHVDQVAQGSLVSFGPTAVAPLWSTVVSDAYNGMFKKASAIGNIGQRDAGIVLGQHVVAQEANIGHQPPTLWKDWRVWLYFYAPSEGNFPTGAVGSHVEQLDVITPGGSTAFGNPAWQVLRCPRGPSDSQCLFVSYFIFGEGAKAEEAGVCAFYHELSDAVWTV